ncbi:MAG: CBS domain-containing protein, partial [Betaproteobacteria bacterium]|nr:CBS domain-containing protein [Betaproteobacteria bacterium]
LTQVPGRKGAKIFSLPSSASVYEALSLMREAKIRSVLVMDGELLQGILSQGDCAMKVLYVGLDPHSVALSSVMTPDPISVKPSDLTDHCMKIMAERRIRHLPVTEQGKVLGMVSVGDIVKELLLQQEQHIKYLETYIKGHALEY